MKKLTTRKLVVRDRDSFRERSRACFQLRSHKRVFSNITNRHYYLVAYGKQKARFAAKRKIDDLGWEVLGSIVIAVSGILADILHHSQQGDNFTLTQVFPNVLVSNR